jgi:hypothetical protein
MEHFYEKNFRVQNHEKIRSLHFFFHPVSAKAPKIAHQRSKRGERKITSKFTESIREKVSRNRSQVYEVKCSLTAIEQWVKRQRQNGKQKPTVKVQDRAIQQTFATLHNTPCLC